LLFAGAIEERPQLKNGLPALLDFHRFAGMLAAHTAFSDNRNSSTEEEMTHSRLGLKALGLCALVLGLMTFGFAGVGQAETGAAWDVLDGSGNLIKIPGTNDLLPEVNAEIEKGTTVIFEFTTKTGTEVEFRCKAMSLVASGGGLSKLGANGSLSKGKAVFALCVTFLNGKESLPCIPKSSGQPFGTIATEEADGLIVLGTGSVPLVLILPLVKNKAGEPIAALIEMGEECAIGTRVEVTGHLDMTECETGVFTTHLVTHLMVEASAFRLLRVMGQVAKLLGSALVNLAGAHAGLRWGGLPS
jgi:hypothetical protein